MVPGLKSETRAAGFHLKGGFIHILNLLPLSYLVYIIKITHICLI